MMEVTDTPYRDVALYAGVGAFGVALVPVAMYRFRPSIGFFAILITVILAVALAFWVTRTHEVDVSPMGESTGSGGSTAGAGVVNVSHGLTSGVESRLRILLLSVGVIVWSVIGFFIVTSGF